MIKIKTIARLVSVFSAALFTLGSLICVVLIDREIRAQFTDDTEKKATLIAEILAGPMILGDYFETQRVAESLLRQQPEILRMNIYDQNNQNIFLNERDDHLQSETVVVTEEIKQEHVLGKVELEFTYSSLWSDLSRYYFIFGAIILAVILSNFVVIAWFHGLVVGFLDRLLGVLTGFTKEEVNISTRHHKITEFNAFEKRCEKIGIQVHQLMESQNEKAKSDAMLRVTQMVAHDVRKPFSLLGSGVQMFKGANSIEEIQGFLPHLESSLDSALTSVNGMLSDIMDVGRDLELDLEPSSIKTLFHQALEETCYVFSESKVTISYQWGHIHLVKVDPMRVRRVLSNILSNACQAMRAREPIWIETTEKAGNIEILIGNQGSFIPEEDLPKLFQAFFTKRKRGAGTGLGLAIAKKIISAHGGTINAYSNAKKNNVEFLITLPLDSAEDHLREQELPSSLSDFSKLKSVAQSLVDDLGSSDDRLNRRSRIEEQVAKTRLPLCIAILDDEEFYRTLVVKLAEHHELSSLTTFQEFSTPNDLLSIDLGKIDFIISDVDLKAEMNGYDVTEIIRSMDLKIPICIHSNKALSQDYEKAIRSGATTFMPKPMTIDHLLRFLTDCLSDNS